MLIHIQKRALQASMAEGGALMSCEGEGGMQANAITINEALKLTTPYYRRKIFFTCGLLMAFEYVQVG